MNPLQIVYGVIGLVLAAGVGTYIYKCESAMTFAQKAAILAEDAKKKAEARAADDRKAKEKADAENERTIAGLRADIKRLRKPTALGGSMSANPAGSRCPDGQVCYDKALYQRTDGIFVAGARGLADEGSEIAVDLATAQVWAKGRAAAGRTDQSSP